MGHQTWPELDSNHNMELLIKCNNSKVANIQVAKWYFDTLTEDQAFDLCCHDQNMQDKWLSYDVIEKKFTKIDHFEATLALTFDVPTNTMSPEEKKKWKQEKKRGRETSKGG